jgi:nitric oxide reductase subunit B
MWVSVVGGPNSQGRVSIFWTVTSFLATGLFLARIVSGREPRRHSWMAYGLRGAPSVVVFGSQHP